MKVSYDRPDRRRHHRVTAPLAINLYGTNYAAVDWCLGGFRIGGYNSGGSRQGENLQVGDPFKCSLTIPFQGFGVSFDVEAEVVRVMPQDDEIAAKFIALSERAEGILSHFIDQIIRGYMTPIEDTIQRIDVPVTPVSIKPDSAPVEERRPFLGVPKKTLIMLSLYTITGILLTTYLSASLYTTLIKLEVKSGVVSAPVEPIVGTVDGRIARFESVQNQLVEVGTPLVVFEDAILEQDIDLAEIAVMRATAEYEATVDDLRLEEQKTADLQDYSVGEVKRGRAKVESVKKQLQTYYDQWQRKKVMLAKGHVSRADYDDAYRDYFRVKGQLDEAESELEERLQVAGVVKKGRYFNGIHFEGHLHELQTAVTKAEQEIVLAVRELDAHLDRRERLVIRAPTTGRIVKFMKNAGSSVKRGEPIALFEREEERAIDVFMTQEEILEIRLGDMVEVYFPATGEKVQTIIEKIDRTQGFIDEIDAKWDWRGSSDRTGQVTLMFDDIPLAEVRERFPPGLPAVATFDRASGREMLAWVTGGSAMARDGRKN